MKANRIQELADKAKVPLGQRNQVFFKFAELIIAECAKLCEPAAQPEQEPVASLTISMFRGHMTNHDIDYFGDLPAGSYQLYTSPPARKPLTREHVTAMMTKNGYITASPQERAAFMHEIEMANIRGYKQGRESGLKEALVQPTTETKPNATRHCRSCGGTGERHTGVDESPTTICKPCDGTGQIAIAAQPEQEPVGVIQHLDELNEQWTKHLPIGTKLYTSPSARPWVSLTDDERRVCTQSPFTEENYRAIEAKLKERNT
jgi:hypothetical protein